MLSTIGSNPSAAAPSSRNAAYLPPTHVITIDDDDSESDSEYWQVVPDIDIDDSVCGLLDQLSLDQPDNRPQQAERTTHRPVKHSQELPSSAQQVTRSPLAPGSSSRLAASGSQPTVRFPSAKHGSSRQPHFRPVSPQLAPQPATTSSSPPQSTRKKKRYYAVTRGRKVGVFSDW